MLSQLAEMWVAIVWISGLEILPHPNIVTDTTVDNIDSRIYNYNIKL